MTGIEQKTATAPDGVVHQLADAAKTRCGLSASDWSREVTRLQELGLVTFCPDCESTA